MSVFSPTLFGGKRFAVVGLGKNGLPAAQGLRAMGADVVAWDDNPAALQAALETRRCHGRRRRRRDGSCRCTGAHGFAR